MDAENVLSALEEWLREQSELHEHGFVEPDGAGLLVLAAQQVVYLRVLDRINQLKGIT